jgi:transposase InsO family protein
MKTVIRNTLDQLVIMKKRIIDKCIEKEMKHKEGAKLINMHPNAFSRLVKRYREHGETALMPKKPGPKRFTPDNRTPEWIEYLVVDLGERNPNLGLVPLADKLEEEKGIKLHQTTIWRILKRQKVRYTREYKRLKQDSKLYCLDTPGEELQMDGCYPYGRSRKIVSFDAIDDCSRYICAKLYDRETTDNAINFVKHLIANVPFRIQKIRVDNRYGKRFTQYCADEGIEVRVNDPYSPQQNGKIERFHGTLKKDFFWKECRYDDSFEELSYKYWHWQKKYNFTRKHTGYGMNRLTPALKLVTTMLQSLYFTNPKKLTGILQQDNI